MDTKKEMPKEFSAKDLEKKEISIEDINKIIWETNQRGSFKLFLMSDRIVSDKVKLNLMNRGFKTYYGDWDGVMKNVFIIEW